MHIIADSLKIACPTKQRKLCILEALQLGFSFAPVCTHRTLESYFTKFRDSHNVSPFQCYEKF